MAARRHHARPERARAVIVDTRRALESSAPPPGAPIRWIWPKERFLRSQWTLDRRKLTVPSRHVTGSHGLTNGGRKFLLQVHVLLNVG